MKKYLSLIAYYLFLFATVNAQDDIYPAKAEKGTLFITNGTVHVGNGLVLENTTVKIENGIITALGQGLPVPQDGVKVIDAKGQQVYPGLILPATNLGLEEIASGVRGSNDYYELGELNPDIRSIVAYNADSKITNTLRANGILLANIIPDGGSISGSSSVVQLDAWNFEDAAYKLDVAILVNMPSFLPKPNQFSPGASQTDPTLLALDKIETMKSFFRQAQAYLQETKHKQVNIKFEAVKGLFNKSQKLFINADQVKQMLIAFDFVREFGFEVVIVGGAESFLIADLLKQNNIPVILNQQHALPDTEDDDFDQPYKTPAQLKKAGVLFAINDAFEETRFRNLMFNAGTAAAYGLTKEEALEAITLNSAKILGINDKTGSIEVGKDANILICQGDILDMRSSIILHAFIQGRDLDLSNKQTQLYQRYLYKYGLK
jgi:imidazolonepropionase-like amidohydrolase